VHKKQIDFQLYDVLYMHKSLLSQKSICAERYKKITQICRNTRTHAHSIYFLSTGGGTPPFISYQSISRIFHACDLR